MTNHFFLTERGRRFYFRSLAWGWFRRLGRPLLLALALAACGGSVEADPAPPSCPFALHALRFSEPTPDPTGTSEATATGCVTPDGQRAAVSVVWCCQ